MAYPHVPRAFPSSRNRTTSVAKPPHGPHIADREGTGFGLSDQHHQLLAPCDASIQEVAGQHRIVLGGQRDDHSRVLGALTFVHGGRIGQSHFIKFRHVIGHVAAVEADDDLALLQVDAHHLANVPVEGIFIVVIDRLDDLIAWRIASSRIWSYAASPRG